MDNFVNQDESIIFTGESTKTGLKTKGYYETDLDNAGFVKVVGKDEFIELSKISGFFAKNDKDNKLSLDDVINSTSADEGGDSESNASVQYVCKVGQTEYEIEPKAYSILTNMVAVNGEELEKIEKDIAEGKDAADLFYRCEDGHYVKTPDVEPNSYKFMEGGFDYSGLAFQGNKASINSTRTKVKLLSGSSAGTEIDIQSNMIFEKDGKFFITHKSREQEVEVVQEFVESVEKIYFQEKVTSEEGAEILVDKILDVDSLQQKGSVLLAGKTEIAKVDIDIAKPIVTIEEVPENKHLDKLQELIERARKEGYIPLNTNVSKFDLQTEGIFAIKKGDIVRAGDSLQQHGIDLASQAHKGTGDWKFLKCKRLSQDGQVEDVYIVENDCPKKIKDKFFGKRAIYVEKLLFTDRVKSDEYDVTIRQNVEQERRGEKKIVSKTIGKLTANTNYDYKFESYDVSEVKYGDDGLISSYKIGNYLLRDITWTEDGFVEDCVVEHEDEVVPVESLRESEYSNLGIKCNIARHITDVIWGEGGAVESFKLGNRKFSNINWIDFANGKINTCDITVYDVEGNEVGSKVAEKIDGVEEYKNLQFDIVIKMRESFSKLEMLRRSELLKLKDGKYVREADVVQASQQVDGVAEAKTVDSVEKCCEIKDEFRKNPYYPVYVVDKNGNVHKLTDMNHLFKEETEFNHDISNVMTQILGKRTIEFNKGKLSIKPTAAEADCSSIPLTIGMALCSTGIGIPLGLPFMALSVVNSLICKGIRGVIKARINSFDVNKLTKKLQKEKQASYTKNLNQYANQYAKNMTRARANLSGQELENYISSETEKFRALCMKEISGLQLLSNGAIKASFDMGKKCKITNENYIAYLKGREIQKEISHGKIDNYHLKPELKEVDKQYRKEMKELKKSFKGKDISDRIKKDKIQEIKNKRVQKRVELLEKYGGKEGKTTAYSIKKSRAYITTTQEYIQAKTSEEQKAAIKSLKEKAKTEYKKYLAQNGSVKDRIKHGLKQTTAYKTASWTDRRKMVADYRKAEEKKIKNASVKSVQFEQQVKGGEPVMSKLGREGVAFTEHTINMVKNQGSAVAPPFEPGNMNSMMSEQDYQKHCPDNFVQSTAKTVKSSTPDLDKDRIAVQNEVNNINKTVDNIQSKLDSANKTVQQSQNSNSYTDSYKNKVKLEGRKGEIEKESKIIIKNYEDVKHKELMDETIPDNIKFVTESAKEYGKDCEAVKSRLEELKPAYDKKVKLRSAEQFKQTYKDQICAFAIEDGLQLTSLQGSFNSQKSKAGKQFVEEYISRHEAEYQQACENYTRHPDISQFEIKQKFAKSNPKTFKSFQEKYQHRYKNQEDFFDAYVSQYPDLYRAFYNDITGRSSATEEELQSAFVSTYLTGERQAKFIKAQEEYVGKKIIEFINIEKIQGEVLKKYLNKFIKKNKLEDAYKQMLVQNDDEKLIEAKVLVNKDREAFSIFAKSNKYRLDDEQQKLKAIIGYYLMVKDKNPERLEELRNDSDYNKQMLDAVVKHYGTGDEVEVSDELEESA